MHSFAVVCRTVKVVPKLQGCWENESVWDVWSKTEKVIEKEKRENAKKKYKKNRFVGVFAFGDIGEIVDQRQ